MAATVWNRSVHRSPKSVPVPVPLRHNTLSGRSWVSLSGDSALALCSLAHGSHVFDGSLWHKSTHPKSSAFQIYWLLGSVVALLLTTRTCFSGSSCCSSDWLFRLSESNIFPDATILLIVTFSVMQFVCQVRSGTGTIINIRTLRDLRSATDAKSRKVWSFNTV